MDQSRVIHGIGVSPGIAIGKAHVLEHKGISIPHYTLKTDQDIVQECAHFEAAVASTEKELEEAKARIHPNFSEHAHVLDVY